MLLHSVSDPCEMLRLAETTRDYILHHRGTPPRSSSCTTSRIDDAATKGDQSSTPRRDRPLLSPDREPAGLGSNALPGLNPALARCAGTLRIRCRVTPSGGLILCSSELCRSRRDRPDPQSSVSSKITGWPENGLAKVLSMGSPTRFHRCSISARSDKMGCCSGIQN